MRRAVNAPSLKVSNLPSSIGATISSGQPIVNQQKSVRIRHQEYLGDVISGSSTSYTTLLTYIMQPGDPNSFPWLSALASRYQRYKWHSITLQYISESPTSTTGAVVLGFDHNAAATTPSTKQQMMELQDSIRCNAWDGCALAVSGSKDLLYTNIGSVYPDGPTGSSADIKTFAGGVFWVGTTGVPATTTLGEIYVTYDVELINPGIFQPTPLMVNVTITPPSASTLFSTSIVQSGNFYVSYISSLAIGFNYVGPFLILFNGTTTTTGGVSFTLTGATLAPSTAIVGTIATTTHITGWCSYLGTGAVTLTFGSIANMNTAQSGSLIICPYDGNAYGPPIF
jgi:hypothetical protein